MSQLLKELAPTGVLRAAINMGNGLLVTGRTTPSVRRAWRAIVRFAIGRTE